MEEALGKVVQRQNKTKAAEFCLWRGESAPGLCFQEGKLLPGKG